MPSLRDIRLRPTIAWGATVVTAAALVAAGLVVFDRADQGSPASSAQAVTEPGDTEPPAGAREATTDGAVPTELVFDGESSGALWPGSGYKVAAVRSGEHVQIRSAPAGELVKRVGSQTEFRSPMVFSVIERRGDWISVATPLTLDNSPGWVRIDLSKLELGRVPTALVADLSEQRVELHHLGEPVKSFPVTIGAAESSTPRGRFAVTDTITRGLSPAYGCCAIALSAHQPNLPPGWLGGDRVAIHGTTGPVGGEHSAGCLRTENAVVEALISDVSPGTPVTVRA